MQIDNMIQSKSTPSSSAKPYVEVVKQSTRKKWLIILAGVFLIIIILVSAWGYYLYKFYNQKPVKFFDSEKIQVSIYSPSILTIFEKPKAIVNADTAFSVRKRRLGLIIKKSLGMSEGMLFVYRKLVKPQFWTRGVYFPIDLIWFNGGKIVEITKNVPPNMSPTQPLIIPKVDIDKVLAVKAGFSEKYQISVGDKVHFDTK